MLEDVAYATDGVDERPCRILVHLAAQAIDMDIDHVGCGINPHAPNMIQDHCPSYDPAGVSAQIFEKRKFLRSQLKQVIAASSLVTQQVQLQVCGLQTYRFILRCGRPT